MKNYNFKLLGISTKYIGITEMDENIIHLKELEMIWEM